MTINTEAFSAELRAKSVDLVSQRLLVTNFVDTNQEPDLTDPPNCRGFGRIRHFKRATSDGWPPNPLPLDPAAAALGIEPSEQMNTQVFQNAVCNWRCWYCYVPFNMLKGDAERSAWVTAEQLVDWYLENPAPPRIIDLSGGQPDLVPEWTLWMVRELERRSLPDPPYLWIDDNLSNDYFWRYLTDDDIAAIAGHELLGRVGCLKGYDEQSFEFNTRAAPELFDNQFTLLARHIDTGVDTYGYATFTSPSSDDPTDAMQRFVDRLQSIREQLPLRVVPLEVQEWGPVTGRMKDVHRRAAAQQQRAIEAWNLTLQDRFDASELAAPVSHVEIGPLS